MVTITVNEYVEKYYSQISSGDMDKTTLGTRMLLKDLANEMAEKMKRRRITKADATFILICETNAKWNKIVESFEKRLGRSPLKKDGFKTWYERAIKEARKHDSGKA